MQAYLQYLVTNCFINTYARSWLVDKQMRGGNTLLSGEGGGGRVIIMSPSKESPAKYERGMCDHIWIWIRDNRAEISII